MNRKLLVAFAFVAMTSLPALTQAEIYKWVDENGNVHFTDQPPIDKKTEQVTISKINTYTSPRISTLEFTPARVQTARKRVVMYSTSWCGACKRAKQYFNENGINYVEYDVETNEKGKQDFRELGGRGVPVILVGNKRLNGFSASSFEKIYRN